MKHLKDWQHGALSVGILLLGLICAYFLLVYPALAKRTEMNETFSDLEFQYNRFASSIREKEGIQTELESLRNSGMDQSQFLQENSSALAAAELQSRIKSLIENNSSDLVSTQVTPNNAEEAFPMITIKVHMRSSIDSMKEIVYQLETDEIVLLIDNLYIQARSQPTRNVRNRQSVKQSTTSEILDVRFDINGFIFQDESA